MDGDFSTLQKLLDKGLISSNDFMCEGFGCIFIPCVDFTNAGHDRFMGKPFTDLDNDMEKKCKNFELRKGDERILVKNLRVNPIKDRQYYVF
jgi:hypothetical protein